MAARHFAHYLGSKFFTPSTYVIILKQLFTRLSEYRGIKTSTSSRSNSPIFTEPSANNC